MKFGSVCSGIEAASVAWHPLGWTAAWLSEIEPFPCAVLKHHYPDVPNHGDMTLLPEKILSGQVEAPDLFCGGTPCQAFSVAGLRNSLDDVRGNLSLTFVGIANAIDHVRSVRGDAPAIVFWENVPGVLNTKDNAFGCFLGALAGESDPIKPPGERWSNAGCVFGPQRTVAWRVLDAQYFGVAQRRRRVFVVASARDDINPTEILFEFEGVRRDTAPRRETGKVTPTISSSGTGVSRVGFNCEDEWFIETQVVGALDTECGGNKMNHQTINSGHLLPISSFYESSLAQYREDNVSGTIKASGGVAGGGSETFLAQPIAFENSRRDGARLYDNLSNTLQAFAGTGGGNGPMVALPIALAENTIGRQPQNGGNGNGFTVGGPMYTLNATGIHGVAQPVAFEPGKMKRLGYGDAEPGLAPTLRAEAGDNQLAVAQPMVLMDQGGSVMNVQTDGTVGTLRRETHGHEPAIIQAMAVRRLTPVECERLQGFPDNYSNIPWRKAAESPDGPRYKALGNSWAVPVVAWIGQRIQDQIK